MPLPKYDKTLLVIVAEAVLERALVRDALALGAQTWTATEVHGAAREGLREGQWEADRTVELKLLCDAAVADAIAEQVLTRYASNYSVSVYFSPVQVLRPDRY
jgi:hypothetical protein